MELLIALIIIVISSLLIYKNIKNSLKGDCSCSSKDNCKKNVCYKDTEVTPK